MIKKIVIGVIGFLIVIGVIGAISGGGKGSTTKQKEGQVIVPTEPTESKPTLTPMKITARELADDFDANQVAAENKWKDKLVEFSAQISNITDAGISFHNVATKEFSLTQISCKVEDKQQLLPLKNGQAVTVQGVVGTQMIGVIDIRQCRVK